MENKMNVAQKAVILNSEGKLLALRRSSTDPHRPLTWDLPGGDLEIGEDPREGMLREIREEAAIEVKNLQLLDVIGRYNSRKEWWIGISYKADAVTTDVVLSFEHDQFEWLTKEEFLNRESSEKLRYIVLHL
jgi:ADP-ribose pyrophosphatase YjhB (NUDIX family)